MRQTLTKREKRAKRNRGKRLGEQKKRAATRAKYGPRGRPAPVTVKYLDGDVIEKWDPGNRRGRYSPVLNERARAAGYRSYSAYLRSAYWKRVRAQVLERDQGRCRLCGSGAQLIVHHDRYDYLGAERLEFLKAMCSRCHDRIHRKSIGPRR